MPDEPQSASSPADRRCDHCGLPFPKPPIGEELDGVTHLFCSEMCRDAYLDHHPDSPVYHGLKQVQTEVSGLAAQLPTGLPRNTFVMVANSPGARWDALLSELVWRTLRRDEPVVVVAYQDPPISIVQQLLTLRWNVLPYLENGQLRVVDCFTYRVSSYDHVVDRFTDWNTYLYDATAEATARLTNPDDPDAVHSRIDEDAESLGMRGEGLVLIDSLYELGTLTQPVHAHNFVKDLRADLSKGRFVPVFAGASTAVDEDGFPRNMTYLVDGVVELSLSSDDPFSESRKGVRVSHMRGVPVRSRLLHFKYEPLDGMVLVRPTETATP